MTNAPTTIEYNPVAYTTPTDYSVNIIGAAPTQRMLVFAQAEDKVVDGTTTATVASLQGGPLGVTLVAGPGTANFDSANVGTDKTAHLTGYSLGGANASAYALQFLVAVLLFPRQPLISLRWWWCRQWLCLR